MVFNLVTLLKRQNSNRTSAYGTPGKILVCAGDNIFILTSGERSSELWEKVINVQVGKAVGPSR